MQGNYLAVELLGNIVLGKMYVCTICLFLYLEKETKAKEDGWLKKSIVYTQPQTSEGLFNMNFF